MVNLWIGDLFDKCIDVGVIVDLVQLDIIIFMVVVNIVGEIYYVFCDVLEVGCFYLLILIIGFVLLDFLMQEEIFGLVFCLMIFCIFIEVIEIVNNICYGLVVMVWMENVNFVFDIVLKLVVGVVWVNVINFFDVVVGFGGICESGFGCEGGWEGFIVYIKFKGDNEVMEKIDVFSGDISDMGGIDFLDWILKFYIGGK